MRILCCDAASGCAPPTGSPRVLPAGACACAGDHDSDRGTADHTWSRGGYLDPLLGRRSVTGRDTRHACACGGCSLAEASQALNCGSDWGMRADSRCIEGGRVLAENSIWVIDAHPIHFDVWLGYIFRVIQLRIRGAFGRAWAEAGAPRRGRGRQR